jgi:hypothetical protein
VFSTSTNNENCVNAYAHDAPLGASAQSTPLTLRKTTPNTKPLVVGKRVFEAFGFDFALGTNLFGIPGGATFFGKEGFGVSLRTQRVSLPSQSPIFVFWPPNAWDTQSDWVNEPVIGYLVPILAHVGNSSTAVFRPQTSGDTNYTVVITL